jgi:hypothetical protein
MDDYVFGVCVRCSYRIRRCERNRQEPGAKEAVPPERKGIFHVYIYSCSLH